MSETAQILMEIAVVALISLPVWVVLLWRRVRQGCFLPYTPRWPVPWGPVGAFLAAGFLVLALLQTVVTSVPADQLAQRDAPTSGQFIENAVFGAVIYLGLVGMLVAFLARTGAAEWSDFGLPSDPATLLGDARLGLLTALAALLPVYGLQLLLVVGLGIESEHQTLLLLQNDPSPALLAAAWLTAGVVAPILEEFIFRLLFQGWLERVEDEALGVAGRLDMQDSGDDVEFVEREESVAADDDNPFSAPQIHTLRKLRRRRGDPPTPPEETIAGLPHGWAPVLVSSFVFALLHLSQGAAVGPLFILALMFGYVYQRTHRITPSIFAHMAFNTLSLVAAYAVAHAS